MKRRLLSSIWNRSSCCCKLQDFFSEFVLYRRVYFRIVLCTENVLIPFIPLKFQLLQSIIHYCWFVLRPWNERCFIHFCFGTQNLITHCILWHVCGRIHAVHSNVGFPCGRYCAFSPMFPVHPLPPTLQEQAIFKIITKIIVMFRGKALFFVVVTFLNISASSTAS